MLNKFNRLEDFLRYTRSKGVYSFTLDNLKKTFPTTSYKTLKQSLYRLKLKNEISLIRHGFYVIIPPEYSKVRTLPPYLFIDDLMKSLHKNYYVGLFSAAALHGSAHQQPMEFSVITNKPAPRNISKLKIRFLAKNLIPTCGIVKKSTPAGYINVSSPELTVLDLLQNAGKLGLNHVLTVIYELLPEIKVKNLKNSLDNYDNSTTIQRLGFVLEEVFWEKNYLW